MAGGTHTLFTQAETRTIVLVLPRDHESTMPLLYARRRTATATYGLPLGLFGRVGVRALGVGVAHVLRGVCK